LRGSTLPPCDGYTTERFPPPGSGRSRIRRGGGGGGPLVAFGNLPLRRSSKDWEERVSCLNNASNMSSPGGTRLTVRSFRYPDTLNPDMPPVRTYWEDQKYRRSSAGFVLDSAKNSTLRVLAYISSVWPPLNQDLRLWQEHGKTLSYPNLQFKQQRWDESDGTERFGIRLTILVIWWSRVSSHIE
jgi:hypothetical protein